MSKKIKLKIKKEHPLAVIPSYAKPGDACMDLTAVGISYVDEKDFGYVEYDFGLSFEVPPGHVMLIYPRSSISNTGMILSNAVGVVDSGYRGIVKARFKYIQGTAMYNVGDRVAQFMILPYPTIDIQEVEKLSHTERGSGGFGSTNNS
jgi:dUTP pyrophosphatase